MGSLLTASMILSVGLLATRGTMAEEKAEAGWLEAYAEVRRETGPNGVFKGSGQVYVWTGEAPPEFLGEKHLDADGRFSLTVDPVAYAQMLASSHWKPLQALSGGGPLPNDCNAMLKRVGAGSLQFVCGGPCPVPYPRTPETSAGYCFCDDGSKPERPSYCSGVVEETSPGTWAWDCDGDCPPTKACKVLCWFGTNEERFYCGCGS